MVIAFILAGMSSETFRISPHYTAEQARIIETDSCFIVRIVDFPQLRARSVKVTAELRCAADGTPLRSKVLLYFQRDSFACQLCYGDVLLVSTQLAPFSAPDNPDAFDNQSYMRRKGLFYSGYVPQYGWQRIDHCVPNPLKAFAHQTQQQFSTTFVSVGMSGRERDIIQAILLGDDETMEPELRATYASAGVSHILCVSGMHVGIIFMILNFLLKPLDLFRSTRMLKAFLLLTIIWLYANITGLSPSVTRAATMFSFVTVGGLLRRNTNVFHSLFASLFLLLTLNPLLLFEVGFQLSYLAVFGIVLIQPVVVQLYHGKTKVGNYFWELLSVSVAAQVSTFPISIYYFGQFPNYFLLSNLTVISLSFAVMITGIVLLSISWLPVVAHPVAVVLTLEIRLMNGIVGFVESLPGAVTRHIDYNMLQVLLLYAFILLLYSAYHYQRRSFAWSACLVFTFFSISFAGRKVKLLHHDEMVVYAVRGASALGFNHHQQYVLFSDTISSDTCTAFRYTMQNHARRLHATWTFLPLDTPSYQNDFLCKHDHFILYDTTRLYLLQHGTILYPVKHPPVVDKLVLLHNPKLRPEQVWQALHFKSVIADASCSEYCKKRWRNYCQQQGIEMMEQN